MSRHLLLALATLIGTIGCTIQPPPATAEPTSAGSALVGSNWILVSLNGVEPLADNEITLRFDADGQVSGSSGCNRYFGGYRQPGDNRLEIGPLAGTRKFCQGEPGQQEKRYLDALQATTGYVLNDRLRLFQTTGALEFRPLP